MRLSDDQWDKISPYIPNRPKPDDGSGRPPHDDRIILEKIIWVLWTGAPWAALPRTENEPSYQTCHRRFQEWVSENVFEGIFRELAGELCEEDLLELEQGFIDATFAAAKKGDRKLAIRRKEKEPKSWRLLKDKASQSPSP